MFFGRVCVTAGGMWLAALTTSLLTAEELPRSIGTNASLGSASAVVVGDVPLVHTAQVPAFDTARATGDAAQQANEALEQLDDLLRQADSSLERAVKLNFYVARADIVATVHAALAQRFAGHYQPAVSFVETPLYGDRQVVADAVATTVRSPRTVTGAENGSYRITPAGTRIYIAGQAARSESLADATRQTLEGLRATLRHLGRRDRDVIQLKAFLTPMADAAVVLQEVKAFFGDDLDIPTVLVEWQSGATVPIEIEVVAWGGRHQSGDAVEFITPPGMTSSPVFSRVARINQTRSIYVSGLYGRTSETPNDAASGEREVKDVFKALSGILEQAGSDLRHLVKATYYVSTGAASSKLNELRPDYYDPKRPPSASKAKVAGVARDGCGLSIDMIAVPAQANGAEYGPPEYGHGLTAEEAAAGWISLFDGASTWGWRDATVTDGKLSGGMTTARLGPCEIRGEAVSAGAISIGDETHEVNAGRFEFKSSRGGVVQLHQGATVSSLVLKPVNLKSIFNGQDLTGWKRIDRESIPEPRRPRWQVEDGLMRARGGPGCVEYQEGKFGDFVLQLDVRTGKRHANGGVFFRAIEGDFMNGYEAQIYSKGEDGDPSRPAVWCTGGIDDRQNARRLVSRDGHFFRYTIVANGPHIATWVNGFQQVDWTDTRETNRNPRAGLRTEPGVLQLQAHDPGTDVEFKNIAIRRFDD